MKSQAKPVSTVLNPSLGPFALQGRLLVDGGLHAGAVVVEGGKIAAVLREPSAAALPPDVCEASVVAPGLIDLQVNGGFGVEVGEDPGAMRHLSARLPGTGVTSFLPTVVTSTLDFYERLYSAYEDARDSEGARPLGLHLEGPYLSPKRAGAHRRSVIENAPAELLDALLTGDALRLMTLAPESCGAAARIRALCDRGIVVSLGHTDATYEEFVSGVDAGASLVTHLYSAMSPFRHRAPGAVGAALLDDRLTVGLIADGVHCHPASIRLALRTKGIERMLLVTDAVSAAGAGPGDYAVDGRRLVVDDTSARLPDGTLAGSILTLDQAVRNVVRLTDAGVVAALRMASEIPARVMGLEAKGRLVVGCDADIVLFDEALEVQATFIEGRPAYRRDEA